MKNTTVKSFRIILHTFLVSVFLTVVFKNFAQAKVQSELVYGPEWTFTSEDFDLHHYNKQHYMTAIYENLVNKNHKKLIFKDIEFNKFNNAYPVIKLITLENIQISIAYDPGVVEVQVSPLSLAQYRSKADFFKSYIFDVMKKVGLQPHEREGAGHLNIGLSYFKKRAGLAERFIIDYLNHPGVGVVLNSLTANQEDAPSLHQYIETKRATNIELHPSVSDILNEFISFEKNSEDADRLELFRKTIEPSSNSFFEYLREKYTAVGLRDYGYDGSTVSSTRLELRQLRPQQTIDDFIKVIEIFEARIKYLEKQKNKPKLINYNITDGWEYLGQYADYLEESGLDYKKYKSLMPKVWRELSVDQFIRQKTKSIKAKLCSGLF